MKLSMLQLCAVSATVLLTTAGCTRSTEQTKASEVRPFTEFERKVLFTFPRRGIVFASPALLARVLRTAPLNEVHIPPCGDKPPTAGRVIKVRIDQPFDAKKTARNVVNKKRGGGDPKPVPEPQLDAESTHYDLSLDKSVWDSTDTVVAIKVLLKDNDLSFPSDDASVTTTSDTAQSMFMCLEPVQWAEDKDDNDPEDNSDKNKDKWPTATFYVNRSVVQTQKFNIRVIVRQQSKDYVLPLIIDPKVENMG